MAGGTVVHGIEACLAEVICQMPGMTASGYWSCAVMAVAGAANSVTGGIADRQVNPPGWRAINGFSSPAISLDS